MKHVARTVTLLLLIPFFCLTVVRADNASSSQEPEEKAKFTTGLVTSVPDGDTISIYGNDRRKYRVRFLHIDAPESTQTSGLEAKNALAKKIFGRRVLIQWVKKDQYDRLLGNIYYNNRWINLEMTQEGWAWHYKAYSKDKAPDKKIAAAELKARESQKGLWSKPEPIAPWDYRRSKKNSSTPAARGDAGPNSVNKKADILPANRTNVRKPNNLVSPR